MSATNGSGDEEAVLPHMQPEFFGVGRHAHLIQATTVPSCDATTGVFPPLTGDPLK